MKKMSLALPVATHRSVMTQFFYVELKSPHDGSSIELPPLDRVNNGKVGIII
jgi:hypothetical protein